MPQIDLQPSKHSHLYELKPISRWWLLLVLALCALALFNIGFADWRGWAALFFGTMLGFALIFVFPRLWLSRLE